MLAPQATMRRDVHDRLGVEADGCGRRWPRSPAAPALAQMVRSSRLAPERAEEAPVHAAVRQQAHVPGVGVGQDRLRRRARAIAPRKRCGDRVEGLVPGDALEPALALRPHAAQRVEDAIGAVDALQVLVDLRAQEALREAMVGVAADADRAAVLDVDRHHAGVRAVVRADDLQPAPCRHRRGCSSRPFHRKPRRSRSVADLGAGVSRLDRRRLAALVHRHQHHLGLGDLDLLAAGRRPSARPPPSTLTVIEVRPTRTVSVKKFTMSPRKTGSWNSTSRIAFVT